MCTEVLNGIGWHSSCNGVGGDWREGSGFIDSWTRRDVEYSPCKFAHSSWCRRSRNGVFQSHFKAMDCSSMTIFDLGT